MGDGFVQIVGWVTPGTGAEGTVSVFNEDVPGSPSALAGAMVELRSADGVQVLDSTQTRPDLPFNVGYTGPYQPGMRYVLVVKAKGYEPLQREVGLHADKTNYCVITLVPSTPPPGH